MPSDRDQATGLLNRICSGDASGSEDLFPLVYDKLRTAASAMLRQERPDHTLQPTALVHEAYLRLVDQQALHVGIDQNARMHFVALAARAMRRILVDHARGRGREKRGGGARKVTLHESVHEDGKSPTSLLELDEALAELQKVDERLVQAAELRLFGGLSVREMAPCMGLSLTRAKVIWSDARAALSRLLSSE